VENGRADQTGAEEEQDVVGSSLISGSGGSGQTTRETPVMHKVQEQIHLFGLFVFMRISLHTALETEKKCSQSSLSKNISCTQKVNNSTFCFFCVFFFLHFCD
jgi:hypothetical protein